MIEPGDGTIQGSYFISQMLTSGGDHRIWVRPGENTNVYGASPFARSTLGYASSTANDISLEAFRYLEEIVAGWPTGFLLDRAAYRNRLEHARSRLRTAWDLDPATQVVFAPSGTDLEYVALALAGARAGLPVTNILLGKDEVGSGCAHSAAGRYFASETALCDNVAVGAPVAGLGQTMLRDLPIRDEHGVPLSSRAVADGIAQIARSEIAAGRHPLIHVVHGSKTGLVLPELAELEGLVAEFAQRATFVVDACQARIDGGRLRQLVALGCIVMLTGSKFIGGPPFSGFALVPAELAPAGRLPVGLATVFRRAEWPAGWTGCEHLPETANPGLLLRVEAALFELERFTAVPPHACERVIAGFGDAVRGLTERLGARLVPPCLDGESLHLATLATLDLSPLPSAPDFALARRWHRVLAARGLRLGQPVKCVRRSDGEWAGTLRISLSMPLIAELAALAPDTLETRLRDDMLQVTQVLEAAQRPVVA